MRSFLRQAAPGGAVILIAILAGALLRAEYLRELLRTPFGRYLLLDAELFDRMARAIVSGTPLDPGDALFRPPLYPLVLAGIYKLVGPGAFAPRILQSLMGLATIVMVARIATRTHGETVGKVAAILAAAYGMFIYHEGELIATTFGVFFCALATMLLVEAGDNPSRGRFVLTGAAIGLASLSHGTLVIMAPIAFFATLLRPADRIALSAALVLGTALSFGAAAARNYATTGEPVIVGSQGGVNFYIGNNPRADGKTGLVPGVPDAGKTAAQGEPYHDTMQVASRLIAERELGRELSASEISDYWFAEAWEWITDHPKDAIVLYLRKLIFFWNGREISSMRDYYDQARRFTPILGVFLMQFIVLLPFALYGIFRAKVRNREQRLLIAFLAVFSLWTAVFFVCSRFRLPAMVWFIPFSAAGMVAFAKDLRGSARDPRLFAYSLAALALLFFVTNPHVVTASGIANVLEEQDAPFHHYNLAILYEREGDDDRAIEEYRIASEIGAVDPRVHLNLGNALTRTRRFEEARAEYGEALRIAPDFSAPVRNNLGILAAHEGDWPEAIREFEASIEADPTNRNAMANLGSAYLSAGRFDEAIVTFRRALLDARDTEPVLRRSLGIAYHESGLLVEAEAELTKALQLNPKDVLAALTLAKICTESGRLGEAEQWWSTARQLSNQSPIVEQAIREYREGRSRVSN
jgi:Flp pilus assembly protein TadD/4-amino-4-deoxy-L-arabinose transferase-like glycosyltransferase